MENTYQKQSARHSSSYFVNMAQGPAHPQQLQDWPDALQQAALHCQGRQGSLNLLPSYNLSVAYLQDGKLNKVVQSSLC